MTALAGWWPFFLVLAGLGLGRFAAGISARVGKRRSERRSERRMEELRLSIHGGAPVRKQRTRLHRASPWRRWRGRASKWHPREPHHEVTCTYGEWLIWQPRGYRRARR